MSMVKAYHGKKCSDLQLCCSNWTASDSFSKNDFLTKDEGMVENEIWSWKDLEESPQTCNNMKMEAWSDDLSEGLKYIPLDPPLEFQDNPISKVVEKFAADFISKLISEVFLVSCKVTWSIPCSQDCHMSDSLPANNSALWNGLRLCWTPELLPYNKCLSASFNSLSTISSSNIDDSSYIKSAVSHDVLTSKQISDMYNVPFDSDIYALPVDMVAKKTTNVPITSSNSVQDNICYHSPLSPSNHYFSVRTSNSSSQMVKRNNTRSLARKLHSADSTTEPIHVTVEEVRQYLHTLYSSSNNTSENKNFQEAIKRLKNPFKSLQNNNLQNEESRINCLKNKSYTIAGKTKKAKENIDRNGKDFNKFDIEKKFKKSSTYRPSFSTNIKETLCNIFKIKKFPSSDHCLGRRTIGSRSDEIGIRLSGHDEQNPPSPITKPPFSKRALPPVPRLENKNGKVSAENSSSEKIPPPPPLPNFSEEKAASIDFASSIEKVKDYGWYWGPISGEAAEKILSNEPDGSFIVRDSSDDYYIFSLTFKLNSIIRHVRIEHDKGNFSFGNSTRFKSHTIVDFIESAVEHSRSGRYLFFLHRRPILGPMRVQLLHPVSRFKEVQSLQHMCRFVILKMVRKDLIPSLPLPRRLLDYLSTKHYYSEHMLDSERKDSSKEELDQLLPFRQEVFS